MSMENFKSILFSIILLLVFGVVIFWSVKTLQSGPEFLSDQKIKQLQVENENLKKELKNIPIGQVATETNPTETLPVVKAVPTTPVTVEPKPVITPTVNKNQSLINEIQSLINKKNVIKLKATGTSVGTLQKFLNVYNNTTSRVDNDYGKTSQALIITFQKSQGLTANGEVNVDTFNKMIDWLKK
jgi:hypothetical protein